MPQRQALLRGIPQVDAVLAWPALAIACEGTPRGRLSDAVRAELDALRQDILAGSCTSLPSEDALCAAIAARLRMAGRPSLRPVLNATGVPLHTNFGRAPLAESAVDAVCAAARGYSNLEYDLETGARGSRHAHVAHLLRALTGAEDALAVNNNAAAVLLALSALTAGREVVISRGELVEIGGAFRVPQVMEQSGGILREVGTTNKTRLSDYESAIGPDTAALLKVHTSNFKLVGFTENAALEDMAELAEKHNLVLIHDLGSGCIDGAQALGLPDEPTVVQSIKAGAHITTFSGDKLLGGPQAGIIVGKADLIACIKKHPLARALRIDKLTLAALEATLRLYLDSETAQEVPVVAMLTATPETLRAKAEALLARLKGKALPAALTLEQDTAPVGGGSAPGVALDGWVVALGTDALPLQALEARLRALDTPIIARIARDRLILDVRTLMEDDFSAIADGLEMALNA